jgi:recombination DNA repair RAD52 pathway protein
MTQTDMIFTAEQKALLDQELDPRLESQRKGGGNAMLKYIEGHDAIDQANRIFGYGNWSSRPLICEQKVLIDPLSGEAVGIAYKAQVELIVRGCHPIVEVGSQPVAAWNVRDTVMSRRKKGDNSEIQQWEVTSAQRTIVESHEMAEKGAVTDALKRALRTFGNQFGNSLYGDGHVDLSTKTDEASSQNGKATNGNAAQAQQAQRQEQASKSKSNGQPLVDLVGRAKNRAIQLGAVHNADEWAGLLQHLKITEIKTEADIAKINGYLTNIENRKASVAK